MSCSGLNFKLRYHLDYGRSAEYVAVEAEAYSKLLRNLGKLVEVVRASDYVGKAGIIEGHPSIRFDFLLLDLETGRAVCYVEVTSDRVNDVYAYILSEKLSKAKLSKYPVWFMYYKKPKRMWRMFSAKYVVTHGEVINWLEGEKPYYRVMLSKGWYFANWVRWLKSHVLRMIRDLEHPSMYEKYLEAWVVA